jgi:Na(+)-translocating NADH:ubiquinone oxidoreductase F subunit
MLWIRKIHKWASLLVGIQFFLWLSSGIYFNIMDHTKAAGNTYRQQVTSDVTIDTKRLVEPKIILAKVDQSVTLTTKILLDQPYYLLTHLKGLYSNFESDYSLVNAYNAEIFVIDEQIANKLAKQSYKGPGEISSTVLLTSFIEDIPKQKNATWQVNFNDDIHTSVYIEQGSGRVVGHSDEEKRFADIFFMLHFMDYGNEASFNNIQIIIFAFITLWLCLSGFVWTIDLGLRGQYKIKYFATKRTIKLFDKEQKSLGEVKLSTHSNMLDELLEHEIALPSSCGGGGTCGRCKVMINPPTKSSSADQAHFSDKELAQGYRLACQHFCNDVEHMTLFDVTDAKKVTLELSKSTFVTPLIKELRFKTKDKSKLSYKAGAFMRFFIPQAQTPKTPINLPEAFVSTWLNMDKGLFEHDTCSRSYSLAESTNNTDELVFVIKIQVADNPKNNPGIGSSYLANLVEGQTIEALGPFEEFFAQSNDERTMVMLGAGSGMAPLRSLIDEQTAQCQTDGKTMTKLKRNIHFFYGARIESDLLYVDEYYQLAQENEKFHYYPTLSRASDEWLGATGYVQQILELNLSTIDELDNIDFYLCGPQAMMTDTIKLLKARGVKDSAIAFDKFE